MACCLTIGCTASINRTKSSAQCAVEARREMWVAGRRANLACSWRIGDASERRLYRTESETGEVLRRQASSRADPLWLGHEGEMPLTAVVAGRQTIRASIGDSS